MEGLYHRLESFTTLSFTVLSRVLRLSNGRSPARTFPQGLHMGKFIWARRWKAYLHVALSMRLWYHRLGLAGKGVPGESRDEREQEQERGDGIHSIGLRRLTAPPANRRRQMTMTMIRGSDMAAAWQHSR